MLTVYTVQIANQHWAIDNGIRVFDITVKSGIKEFAPTWELLNHYRANEIDWRHYTRDYLELMHQSKVDNPSMWSWMYEQRGNIALACYCKPGRPCHRHLFKDILFNDLNGEGIEVIDGGEVLSPFMFINEDVW